ncbi:MAG: outer membrane beta-barrel domain-containing protein [Archangium sp.]|nr:outer membrane beta-barrel domain-containing protein [Archangium sp.]
MNWKSLILCCAAGLTLSQPAWADDESDALIEKVVVRNRLFNVRERWEVGGNFGLSLLSRLTDHYNLNVSGAYNVSDWLGVELRGGYAISMHTQLVDQLRSDFLSTVGPTSTTTLSDAADLWEMTANAVIGVRFQPIYGKLNLMAELPVHFQFYLWAGGGFGLFKKESVVLCTARTGNTCNEFLQETKPGPLVSLALGLRVFLHQNHSIKFEARSFSYLDSYYVGVKPAAPVSNPTEGGQLSPNAGITNLVMLDVGYAFIF